MIEKTRDLADAALKSRLLDYWRDPDQGPPGKRQTATPESIDEFESRHGIRFPLDLRSFLEEVGGFDQGKDYQDARGFNFWPLSKISRVSDYNGHRFKFSGDRSYFLFCDYLDFSWAYAIRLGEGKNDVVAVGTSDGKPKQVARSFTEFVIDYLRDDAALYP
jgi:hypothetical protein